MLSRARECGVTLKLEVAEDIPKPGLIAKEFTAAC